MSKLRRDYTLLILIVLAGFCFTLVSFYPGFLNLDSVSQLQQAQGKVPLTDWHPPGMALLWRLLIFLTGQVSSLLVFQLLVYWLAFGVLAVTIRKYTGSIKFSLLPMMVAFLPSSIITIGIYWKDVLMAAVLCLVAALLYLGSYTKKKTKASLVIFIVSTILIIYSGNLRHNVLPALIPLAYAASYNFFSNNRKTLLATIAIIALVPISVKTIESVFNVQRLNFTASVMINDLKSILTEEEIMASGMALETKRYVLGVRSKCGEKNEAYAIVYDCGSAADFRNVANNDYRAIRKTWILGVMGNAREYIKFRTLFYWKFITETKPFTISKIKEDIDFFAGPPFNDDLGFVYLTDDLISDVNADRILTSKKFKPASDYYQFFINEFGFLNSPITWLIIGVLLVGYHRMKLSRIKMTYSALAILFSGVLYLLTYYPILIAYESRYIYWSIISISIALALIITEYNNNISKLRTVTLNNSKKLNLKKYNAPDLFIAYNHVQSLIDLYASAILKLPKRKKHKVLVIGFEAKKLSAILSKNYSDNFSYIDLRDIASGGVKQKTVIYSALKKIKVPMDVIFIYNALELIEDDISYLSEINNKITTGGVLAIMAPAHQALYSSIDKLSNYHRRYGLMELKKILNSSGFSVIKSYYCNPIGAIGYMIYKLVDNGDGKLSTGFIAYYDKYIFRLSQRLQIFTKKLFGKNIVLLAVK